MRIFYVLHISERVLGDCLEAIRFLSNPAEKHPAHITVRGPYQKRISIKKINERWSGEAVRIDRAGNFFDHGQNTVFFHCTCPNLEDVWRKREYSFNPHITLYDGRSSVFARKLYEVVSKYSYGVSFKAGQLQPIFSAKGQESFSLKLAFNKELVVQVANQKIDPLSIDGLSEGDRLRIIDKLCECISTLSAGSGPQEASAAVRCSPKPLLQA